MSYDVNALLSEIATLRQKLQFFEQYHQCCSIVPSQSPPGASDDIVALAPAAELQIIPFCAQSADSLKRNRVPRWRLIADDMLKGALVPEHWTERRADFGLDTDPGTCWVPGAILGAPIQARRLQSSDQHAALMGTAQATQNLAGAFSQLHDFMELILVSLCAVLEALRFPVEEINNVMRVCISNSEDINLKRLRRGAIWVNGTIGEMYRQVLVGKVPSYSSY